MNVDLVVILATAFVTGAAHAIEPDHVVAVTGFVCRRPDPIRALAFGVRWAIGHSVSVVLIGAALVLLDLQLPPWLDRPLQFSIGVLLVAIGIWVLLGEWRTDHAASSDSVGTQAFDRGERAPGIGPGTERIGPAHSHGARSLWVGVIHGFSGHHFVAVLPVTLLATPAAVGGYLLVFCIGTVLAMAAFAGATGLLLGRADRSAPVVARALRLVTVLASFAIGAVWIAQAVAGG